MDNTLEQPEWIKFSEGDLNGINLFLIKSYQKIAYPNGEYDKAMLEDFKMLNTKKTIIFDVGGFMGVSSLLFSKIAGKKSKIVSFEPNPYNLKRMVLNFSHNKKLSQNITNYNLALSNENGKANFFLSNNIDNGNSSTSRLNNTHVEYSRKQLLNIGFFDQEINVQTLDNFVSKHQIKPDIIKVDIEGAEHLFLIGAQQFLKSHSPILYIELHSQYCALKCTEIMDNLGYKNMILFEEPDNRLIVKFYKDKTIDHKNICLVKKNRQLKNQNTQLKKYIIKLTNHPIIKTQLKIYRLLKNTFSHF